MRNHDWGVAIHSQKCRMNADELYKFPQKQFTERSALGTYRRWEALIFQQQAISCFFCVGSMKGRGQKQTQAKHCWYGSLSAHGHCLLSGGFPFDSDFSTGVLQDNNMWFQRQDRCSTSGREREREGERETESLPLNRQLGIHQGSPQSPALPLSTMAVLTTKWPLLCYTLSTPPSPPHIYTHTHTCTHTGMHAHTKWPRLD